MKETKWKEARVFVTANGYTISLKEYRGEYVTKDWFVAKTLEEVKKIMEQHLLAPKDY